MSRFAAIDVGTNAMRCLVAEVDPAGAPRVLESIREPVRLGSHVFLTGNIGPAMAARAVEAFRLFRRLIDTHGVERVRAVATSAFREARDSDEVREEIRRETGIRLEVIDGAAEAHLVRRAVASRLDVTRGRFAAVDVGGGSVEILVMVDGDIVRTESFTIGAVRLLEALRGPREDGGKDFYALLTDYVTAIRARVRTAIGDEKVEFAAATGGSAETLAELAGETTTEPPVLAGSCRVLTLDRLREWSLRLSGLTFRQRVDELGLREDRADVILPAAVVYLKMGEIFGTDRLFVPEVGLKDGLLLDMVEDLERQGALRSRRREVRAAALGLGRRYALDLPHAEKVTDLALSVFDQLADLHGLGDEARTLLLAAALLHDVGLYVSASKHHKHSWYLISQSDLVGLDHRQREIVANVARYHRRRHPTDRHEPYAALAPEDREMVRKLSAILRAADVLDREHSQHVASVEVIPGKRKVRLAVRAGHDLLLERWASHRKFALFEEVFGLPLEIEEV